MKVYIIILLLLANLQSTFAQATVSGRITESETNEPLEFVNITLLKNDSTFLTGVVSDANGLYHMSSIADDDYLLTASYIGYTKAYIPISIENKQAYAKDIILQSTENTLASVTVTGNAIIKKLDRQIITPTELQLKTSTNGFNLLQNLQLSRISVDPFNKKLNVSGGGDVQLRINGVQVEINEITALLPADILRIEYHDEPSIRYGGATAVIDIITKKKEFGGSISTDLQNGISNIGFAEDNVAVKVNHKKSEFSANAYFRYRKLDWTRQNVETFNYPDHTIERIEIGRPTEFKEKQLHSKLNYSYVEDNKYFFNIAFKYYTNDTPKGFMNREGEIFSTNKSTPIGIKDLSTEKTHLPSLDLYYQHQLKNNQLIIFNVVGTYIDSENTRIYQEQKDNEILTDIFSDVSGNKYSLITEVIYEKKFSSSKLVGGVKHLQSYTSNKYAGTSQANIGMNQAETYTYTEYQIKYGKFNYSLGAGLSRNYYRQSQEKKDNLIFQPSLRISYDVNDNTNIRLNSYISSNSPSLSDLNNVAQLIDSMQIRRGNPLLSSSWHTSNAISVGYKKGIFSSDFYIKHIYENKPVMSETRFENNKFVQTFDNQKSGQRMHSELLLKLQPWKDYISLSVTPGLNYFINNGNHYTHEHTNWYIKTSVLAKYKNIIFQGLFETRRNWQWGENLNEGERIHMLSLGYKRSSWALILGTINLFEKNYTTTNKNLSTSTPRISNVSSRNIAPMFYLNLSWNIDFGRMFNSKGQRINNNDNDSGIMSGNK